MSRASVPRTPALTPGPGEWAESRASPGDWSGGLAWPGSSSQPTAQPYCGPPSCEAPAPMEEREAAGGPHHQRGLLPGAFPLAYLPGAGGPRERGPQSGPSRTGTREEAHLCCAPRAGSLYRRPAGNQPELDEDCREHVSVCRGWPRSGAWQAGMRTLVSVRVAFPLALGPDPPCLSFVGLILLNR